MFRPGFNRVEASHLESPRAQSAAIRPRHPNSKQPGLRKIHEYDCTGVVSPPQAGSPIMVASFLACVSPVPCCDKRTGGSMRPTPESESSVVSTRLPTVLNPSTLYKIERRKFPSNLLHRLKTPEHTQMWLRTSQPPSSLPKLTLLALRLRTLGTSESFQHVRHQQLHTDLNRW